MSGRTGYKKEVMQWGYVALIGVALAFTTISGATASTKSGSIVPEFEGKWCAASHTTGEIPQKRAGEAIAELTTSEPPGSLAGSVFVNTSFHPFTSGSPMLGSSPEKHAE